MQLGGMRKHDNNDILFFGYTENRKGDDGDEYQRRRHNWVERENTTTSTDTGSEDDEFLNFFDVFLNFSGRWNNFSHMRF